jgi:hypothetical protein
MNGIPGRRTGVVSPFYTVAGRVRHAGRVVCRRHEGMTSWVWEHRIA